MLLIKNGKILTMAGENYEKGYILIDGKKIIKAGDIKELKENELKGSDITVIDAEGKYVLPGFIDAHCHVGMCEDSIGFEGDDTNEMTDPITPHLRAIDGIFHMDRSFVEARENGV